MSFPYLTTAAVHPEKECSQRAEETVVKSEALEETAMVQIPTNYTTSSSSPSRAASPTIELYTALYNTLSNRAHTLADELERDGTAQVKVEVERELAVKREGEKMKRKRSSSVDRSERDSKSAKVVEVLSESTSTTSSLEKSGLNKEKAEQENLEEVSTTSHRRRSSLPSLPKPIFTPSARTIYKKPLFSLDTFLRESNSNPSSARTSPVLSAAQLPLQHPLHLTTRSISIPLARSFPNGEDLYLPTSTPPTTRKVELSSVVRSFEKVLKERAEGWKRLEEVEERWAARAVDDWHF